MFSDLMALLESLMMALSNTKSSDFGSEKAAKQLMKVYLEIDGIVSRGQQIMASVGEKTVSYKLLVQQQKALEKIDRLLKSQDIASVLAIHPEGVRRLKITTIGPGKHERIQFHLSQLFLDRGDFAQYLDTIPPDDSLSVYHLPVGLKTYREIPVVATGFEVDQATNRLTNLRILNEEFRSFLRDESS